MDSVTWYRQLYRRINRLPVDTVTLGRLKATARRNFQNKNSNIDRFRTSVNLLDDILVDWKFDRLHAVLDLCYTKWTGEWARGFVNMPYLALKNDWPQVHLINEIGDAAAIDKYNKALQAEQNHDFSVVDHFQISTEGVPSIAMVKHYAMGEKSRKLTVAKLREFYHLITLNRNIVEEKLPCFEVVYPTNRFANPIHPLERNKLLQAKVLLVKNLLQKHKPIQKHDLQHLYQVAIHKPKLDSSVPSQKEKELEINPNFFRYMLRIKPQYNPVLKRVRSKHLIPSDNNIRKIYRSYVMRLFYIENGVLTPSWMKDYYENENPIPVIQELLETKIEQ